MPALSLQNRLRLRRKAPQLIAITIIAVIVIYVGFILLEDVVIEGAPLASNPIIGAVVGLMHDVTSTIQAWSYVGVFVLMLLESSSLPIPSEAILPFAGYLVMQGIFDFWITVAVATVAGIAGSLIDYYIGYKGVDILYRHRILGRVLLSKSQLEVVGRWFTRYGAIVVIFSRLVPGFRTIVSFPAGAVKMPLGKFIAYTTVGCTIWNSLLIYVGVFLGAQWKQVAGALHYFIIAAVVGFGVLVVAYLIWRRRRIRRAAAQADISVV
jgi:membrane protein DedA with SNARE-associated domain